jgi:PTS system mannose-specific IIA component
MRAIRPAAGRQKSRDREKKMIGLVLVTHGRLAEELVNALEHIVGPQENVASVCIGADDDMEQRRNDIMTSTEAVNVGDGVIVLTDMFGGTPANLAISIMDKVNVEVIAGVNMPMLVKLATVREKHDIAEAVAKALDAGKKYINVASQLLVKE